MAIAFRRFSCFCTDLLSLQATTLSKKLDKNNCIFHFFSAAQRYSASYFWQVANLSTVFSRLQANNVNSDLVSVLPKQDTLYRAVDILIKGHEKSVLDSYMTFMVSTANYLDINVAGQLKPKYMADRLTLLKSIHIHKKHRVQYEIRTHREVLQLKYLTGASANVFLEYVERNLPAGVAMHVHKWELEQIPKHIQERMKENILQMSEDDWKIQSKFVAKMKEKRASKEADYEEYHTTKRSLLGTVM